MASGFSYFADQFGDRLFLNQRLLQPETRENPGFRVTIPIEQLSKENHGILLCYPGSDLNSFEDRKKQLEELGVGALVLEGSSKVGRFGVVGKGCVSIVVKADLSGQLDPVALKIRRADANR